MAEEINPFPLEKILTISAREYCEMQGKDLSDYEPVGVHYYEGRSGEANQGLINFAKTVPKGTEVIVSYSARTININFCVVALQGTALIPKKERNALARSSIPAYGLGP
ncbi:hypothetical protein HYV50_01980 [Candidatus Pacearchaeota archaeon]|nr:hypothetical protein [Candidatus Pacearchaeota archaeon]